MLAVLNGLGAKTEFSGNTLSIDASSVDSYTAPYDLVRQMRASIVVLGPLVARFGEAEVSAPGGCNLGLRKFNFHLDGLRALGNRSNLPELRGFTTAMVQADAFGIPVGKVLRVQSSEMRVKRRQLAEEKAQKVPVKILFPLIFCILPTLFIAVMGPAVISMMSAFSGAGL